MRPKWRVYLDHGTYDSLRHEPIEVPPVGFICAVQWKSEGVRQIMHGWDHYWFNQAEELWWGQDLQGLLDTLEQRVFPFAYVRGRMVGDQRFKEIMDRAHHDTDFL